LYGIAMTLPESFRSHGAPLQAFVFLLVFLTIQTIVLALQEWRCLDKTLVRWLSSGSTANLANLVLMFWMS